MTSGYPILQMKDDDVLKILAAQLHAGSKDVDFQMETYVWKKKPRTDNMSVINIRKFWEKLVLAARAIVAVENPADVCAISCQSQGEKSSRRRNAPCLISARRRTTCRAEIRQIHRSDGDR